MVLGPVAAFVFLVAPAPAGLVAAGAGWVDDGVRAAGGIGASSSTLGEILGALAGVAQAGDGLAVVAAQLTAEGLVGVGQREDGVGV